MPSTLELDKARLNEERKRTCNAHQITNIKFNKKTLVSFAAVIRVVTQWGEALRDDPTNGCEILLKNTCLN